MGVSAPICSGDFTHWGVRIFSVGFRQRKSALSRTGFTFFGAPRCGSDPLGLFDRPDAFPFVRGAFILGWKKGDAVSTGGAKFSVARAAAFGHLDETERFEFSERGRDGVAIYPVRHEMLERAGQEAVAVPAMVAQFDFQSRKHTMGG